VFGRRVGEYAFNLKRNTLSQTTGMVIGSVAIVIGTVIMALTSTNASESQFMGGRFFVGWGVSIAAAAGKLASTLI
jgi:hypothetical protein